MDSTTWRRRRRQAALTLVLSFCAALADAHELPEGEKPEPVRAGVRSSAARIVEAVRTGRERSCTFRRLITTIERSDGIVFVEPRRCRGRLRACFSHAVTIAGEYRLLFVAVDLDRVDEKHLVELIGHELQHAVEILSDPSIKTFDGIKTLMRRLGHNYVNEHTFDTDAALEVQGVIRQELRRAGPACTTGSSG